MTDPPNTFAVELQPRIPQRLSRLPDLCCDLMYSWDGRIRGLFRRLDAALWEACGHNPKVFLRRVAQDKLDEAASDPDYLYEYHAALAAHDVYLEIGPAPELAQHLDPATDLVAYFCAEFGLHESLPIYSGGLGILAGDHCKAASDLRLPLVAVGLFYRQGYFTQQIDGQGQQQALYVPVTSDDVPITPVLDADGKELRVTAPVGAHGVQLRVWEARAGHVRLILLDCDVPENAPQRCEITYQLYGGGSETRIQQEIVMGIGGVRALRAMGLAPTVWHVNEGHAAFSILERIRERFAAGMSFDTALECVAAGTVFTTHTPVPAGHDRFPPDLLDRHLGEFLAEFGKQEKDALALGAEPDSELFNMTALALRGSRFVNGVSKVHGEVASRMEAPVWPQIDASENPVRSVTNGVHLPTFLSRTWMAVFHDDFPNWTRHLTDADYWHRIDEIPYHRFVAVRHRLKRDLLTQINRRVRRQHLRNGTPEALIARITQHVADPDSRVLVLGFARRFATYKRAMLLLRHRDRLARLLNDERRPAVLILAGKAHPQDAPGQELIRELHAASMEPDLIGRLIVVEGYDLQLARHMVQGCDVWLNTPEYPLEACGTSGMKAGLNGAVNISVLDGWWPEGFTGDNGFAIRPVGPHLDADARVAEEARQLLDILEHRVAPAYYGPRGDGWGADWVRLSKNAMKSLIPRFNAERMVHDYLRDAYGPAARRARRLAEDDGREANELAQWKARVRAAWDKVHIELDGTPETQLKQGERLSVRVKAHLGGLSSDDVIVECVIGGDGVAGGFAPTLCVRLEATPGTPATYSLDFDPLPGLQRYRIRAYPHHPALAHPFEMGCMAWV